MAEAIRAALHRAAARLTEHSETPRLDAELLMAKALAVPRETLLLGRLDDLVPDGFEALLARRLGGEPMAYILGSRAFWTIELAVTPAVLIPRPDSETLIEAAVGHFRGATGPARILDLGTGSGALLLAALSEWPQACGIGVDRSTDALAVARVNAARLGMAERATFMRGDWAEALAAQFDLILCNPPYVEEGATLSAEVMREPHAALFAGADGLDAYRVLAPQVTRLLAPHGIACVEVGSTQAPSAGALFAAQGLAVDVKRDLSGHDRCLVLRLR